MGLRDLLRKIPGIGSLERGDHTSASDRPVENIDAMAAAYSRDIDFDPSDGGAAAGSRRTT